MRAEDRYDSLFQYYGLKFGWDWLLLKAQCKKESSFDPDAINARTGARGLMQFMLKSWEEWRDATPGILEIIDELKLLDPRDPEDAIHAAAAYMAWLRKRPGVEGNISKALAAYVWGIGNFQKFAAPAGRDWMQKIPEEAREYINTISRFYDQYLAEKR